MDKKLGELVRAFDVPLPTTMYEGFGNEDLRRTARRPSPVERIGQAEVMWTEAIIDLQQSMSAANSQEKTESGSTAPRRRRKAGGPSR